MLKDFELAARRFEEIKQAGLLGSAVSLAAKPLVAAGKWIASNPLKSLGAALTGGQVLGDAKTMAKSVSSTPVIPHGTFRAGPTF